MKSIFFFWRYLLMSKKLKRITQGLSLFTIGGIGYVCLENLWRGYSHITMFFAGGLSFLLIEIMDIRLGKKVGVFPKCILGSAIITVIEFLFGCVFNLHYKMNVWDYSHLPFNLFGQISAPISILWGFLTFPVLYLGRGIRKVFFRPFGEKASSVSHN